MQGLESHYYEREGGKVVVPLRVKHLRELFSSFDPSPFRDKDLDDDVEIYIVDALREIASEVPFKIVIHVEDPGTGDGAPVDALEASIRRYFRYRKERTRLELRTVLREGRLSLVIGLVFLSACLLGRHLLSLSDVGATAAIAAEGLLIMGWVAMWRPIQTFLYDWWPMWRRIARFERLTVVEVEVRQSPHTRPESR